MNIQERFDQYYFGDVGIQRIVLDVDGQSCALELDRAALMQESQELFDWKMVYRPAQLNFQGVRKVSFPEDYCFNYCIVDYSATPTQPEGYYLFSFTMTGGWDNDTFMRKIEILAKDFSLTGTVEAGPQKT